MAISCPLRRIDATTSGCGEIDTISPRLIKSLNLKRFVIGNGSALMSLARHEFELK